MPFSTCLLLTLRRTCTVGFLGLLLLAIALTGCGGGTKSTTITPITPAGPPVPASDHVFVVVLENHSFSDVIGSSAMPFLNSLATQHSLATNYFANLHPSIPNYFMLTVGLPETVDDAFTGTVTDDNIVRAFSAANISWKAYVESLPSTGYTGPDVLPLYLKHHNPFAYMSDVLNSSTQVANMVDFSQLSADLSAGTLPRFGFIVPNPQHDAHDCPGSVATCADTDKLAAADTWLKNNIGPFISSPGFGNSVLVITFDESDQTDIANGGGQVATILLGPHIKTGFRSTTFYQHQSLLRMVMDSLKVSDLPNTAAVAPSMGEFFQ